MTIVSAHAACTPKSPPAASDAEQATLRATLALAQHDLAATTNDLAAAVAAIDRTTALAETCQARSAADRRDAALREARLERTHETDMADTERWVGAWRHTSTVADRHEDLWAARLTR